MLTQEQKEFLNKLSVWELLKFPNGSRYRKQRLPEGIYDGVEIEKHIFSGYWSVQWSDGTISEVSFKRQPVGSGSNLGVHFCTKDQALTALL